HPFPYTTLFRSRLRHRAVAGLGQLPGDELSDVVVVVDDEDDRHGGRSLAGSPYEISTGAASDWMGHPARRAAKLFLANLSPALSTLRRWPRSTASRRWRGRGSRPLSRRPPTPRSRGGKPSAGASTPSSWPPPGRASPWPPSC